MLRTFKKYTYRDLVQGTSPRNPQPPRTRMRCLWQKEYKHEIQFEKKRPVRTKVVKVTLFDSEFKLLEDKNPYNSVAKLLRESALKAVKQEDVHTVHIQNLIEISFLN